MSEQRPTNGDALRKRIAALEAELEQSREAYEEIVRQRNIIREKVFTTAYSYWCCPLKIDFSAY